MIINYITDQLRDLFYHPTNEFNIPTWAQSMELLVSNVSSERMFSSRYITILSKKEYIKSENFFDGIPSVILNFSNG